jgi:Tol biopolymer transport system component
MRPRSFSRTSLRLPSEAATTARDTCSLQTCDNSASVNGLECWFNLQRKKAAMHPEFASLRQLCKPLLLTALMVSAAARTSWSEIAKAVGGQGEWWVEVATAAKTYRVRPDGSGWTEVAHSARRGIISPDGKRVVYTDSPRLYSEIFVADANGTNVQQLTNNDANDGSPSWTKDGKRIVFDSDRSDRRSQVYVMDADGANVSQLTREPIAAESPRVGPDGRLAYLKLLEERCKFCKMNLIVRDRAGSRAIVKKPQWYTDFAWSPEGTMIAYSTIGSLVFHELATGKESEI